MVLLAMVVAKPFLVRCDGSWATEERPLGLTLGAAVSLLQTHDLALSVAPQPQQIRTQPFLTDTGFRVKAGAGPHSCCRGNTRLTHSARLLAKAKGHHDDRGPHVPKTQTHWLFISRSYIPDAPKSCPCQEGT